MPGIHVLLLEKVLILKKDVDGRDKCIARRHPRQVFGDMTDTS
jgi:hypothetical protein